MSLPNSLFTYLDFPSPHKPPADGTEFLDSSTCTSKASPVKRSRKSDMQRAELKTEFLRNPDWTPELIAVLARKVGLSRTQVYKWRWDYRQKLKSKKLEAQLECKELMPPTSLQAELYNVKCSYKRAMLNYFRSINN
jgi:hypothetical protein